MNSQNNQITSPSKKNDKKIRSSHGPNDTHITLYLPPTNRRHVPLESIECADPRFKEEINKHINDENFLETDIGKHLERKIKPMMIDNGWLYMGYHSGAFYAFDCIEAYKCCMKHIKKKPFWKDMPDIKITKIVICGPSTVGRKSDHPVYGGKDYVLVGNTCEYRNQELKPNTRLQVAPKEYRRTIWEGINAPAEFNIEYDEDGEAIFNKTEFIDFLAQMMKTIIDKQVEERVGSIETATTVVPSTSIHQVEELPLATEIIAVNENQAVV
jgi:hypothetical protein